MKLALKKTIQKSLAVLLVVVSVLGIMDTGNTITYANTINDGMIYCANDNYIETKKTADPNGKKANGLVHGKTLYILGQTTGEDGKLWYHVKYYTGTSGKTENEAYCPSEHVLLNKDMVATSTGKANGDITLWSCTKSYQNPSLATIPSGTKLYITENKQDSGLWYRIYCDINGTRIYGWVEASGVSADEVADIPTDASFEAQLRQAGFPESYIKPLAILHEQYPNWKFNPIHTNLDWNTVVAQEAKGDRNLVSAKANDAMKSTTIENYDWYKNTWMPKDNGSWVSASADYIAYCMDPRNFLDAKNIFMFEKLNSGVTLDAAGVNTIIKGTFMENNKTDTDGSTLNYADTFVKIGTVNGVSAYHLAARVRQEQGVKGTSSLISGTYPGYEGYFNYFNIGASGKNKTEVLEKGIKKAYNEGWNTRYKSLEAGASFLKDKYINIGQNTLYFQKFNVVYKGSNNNQLYNHQYMQNVDAARSEGLTMASAHVDLSKALVFDIPVYLNMPETAVRFTASGNPNNYLKSLSISGVSLSPSFDGAKTEYTAFVDGTVSSVTVSANAVASTSKITGTDKPYDLVIGTNTIKVICTAENGAEKVYTITIVRQDGTGVHGTRGDINGDGKITIADLVRLNRHILGVSALSGEQLIAADVNANDKVNIQDLVLINRHILGISTIN